MKIKKFNEEYKIDYELDIAEETSKSIISKYIDDLIDGNTLQDSFDFYCRELEESQRYIVAQTLLDMLYELNESRVVEYKNDYYIKKDAGKYNI